MRATARRRCGRGAWALALAVALLWTAPAAAERAWVKGEVRLNLRSGAGTEFRILGGVKTGDPLDVLDRRNNWTRVKTREGLDGWIPAGYLDAVPPPLVRLSQLEEESATLKKRLADLDTEAGRLRGQNEELASSDAGQRETLERLERENIGLRAGARWPHWITGALILSTGMVLGAILSRVSARGRRQRIRL